MVRRDPALGGLGEVGVAEHVEVLVRDNRAARLDDRADLERLGRGVEPQAGVQALLHRRVAPRAAEDERDGRQQALGAQPLDDVDA